MASHRDHLQGLCRLCGQNSTVNGKNPVSKTKKKIKDLIKNVFGLDVTTDSDEVYPPDICDNCRRNVKRWWKKSVKKRIENRPAIDFALYPFKEHSDDCVVCSTNSDSSPTNTLKEEAIQIAHNLGFAHWEAEDGQNVFVVVDPKTICATRSVVIFPDLTWKVEMNEITVTSELIPMTVTKEALLPLFSFATSPLCIGNPDFPMLISPGRKFNNLQGEVIARVHSTPPVRYGDDDDDDTKYGPTIRRVTCKGIAEEGKVRCNICQTYRSDLAARVSQHNAASTSKSNTFQLGSHARNDTMPREMLQSKATEQQKHIAALQYRLRHMQEQVDELMKKEALNVNDMQSYELKNIITSNSTYMDLILEKDTPQRLLWEEQKKYMNLKDSRSMRWHPTIIRWCIALHAKSPVAFKALRSSGFLKLPHESTLFNYTHFLEAKSGVNCDILQHLAEEAKLYVPGSKERNITLIFDEMKIKAGLVFSQRTGSISGFTERGTINEQIAAFERRVNFNKDPPIATYMLVLMARGIFSSFKKPVSFYPCTGFSGVQLFHVLWEAVERLELYDFHVRAFVSDGASPNRKFYQLHSDEQHGTITYCTPNPVNPARNIYFICDVPHLVKTTRNCWENSGWNSKTRNLRFRGKEIRWKHLVDAFDEDVGKNKISPGLRKLHKLTNEHIRLQPSLRMRVYLAAQVLSKTVACYLECKGDPRTQSTELFIRYMDTFFDCMNVSNAFDGPNKEKPSLYPYRSMDDPRFKWLTTDFLNFLDEWQAEGDTYEKQCREAGQLVKLTADEKKRMCLSPQTLEGLRITVYSITDLTQALLSLEDVEYVLTEKFSQDPLEEYFSKQRGSFGCNDNPTSFQFGNLFTSLLVQGSAAVRATTGNCRNFRREEDLDKSTIDPTPLKRRKPNDAD